MTLPECPAATTAVAEPPRGARRLRPVPCCAVPDVDRHLAWSTDASMVAAVDGLSESVVVWHAETGQQVATADSCAYTFVIFTPDFQELLRACRERLVGISTETWQHPLREPRAVGGWHVLPRVGRFQR